MRDMATITGYRRPTPYEIKFGEGAMHYKDFPREQWERYITGDGRVFRDKEQALKHCNNVSRVNGTILSLEKHYAKWTKCPFDGLRYYR